MGMLGPYNLTVGQPYKLNIPQDSKAIELQNDSQYDVFVSFKMTAPAVVSVSNGEWDAVVRRGHTSVIPVYGQARAASAYEASRNALAQFQGTLWLLSTNPGALAQSGTVSGRNNVYVTPIAPYDSAPMHAALSTQHDITSQNRLVTVPISVLQWAAGIWTPTSGGKLIIQHLTVPSALASTGHANVYLYGCSFTPANNGWEVFNLQAVPQDSGGTDLASAVNLQSGSVALNTTNYTGYGHQYTAPAPLCCSWVGTLPTNTARIAIQLLDLNGSTTRPTVAYNVACNVDEINETPVADIGNASLWYSGSNAPIY